MHPTPEDAPFERRLDRASGAPVAVAVSGGADSILALIATVRWASTCGRPVLALSVDHRLQPASGAWADFVGVRAGQLGAEFRRLTWSEEKPATGIPAAARAARHCLLASAARAAGARVLVLGHTGDDARENALLGQGAVHEWSPSPVWPHGRDVFILRPLLGLRREAVRRLLTEAGESWIDDPANDDLGHPRIRARQTDAVPEPTRVPPSIADLARQVRAADGSFLIPRQTFLDAGRLSARRVLGAALTCAGGRERPARPDRVDALLDRLHRVGEVKATLSGALCLAGDHILIVRDAGEKRRGRLTPIQLQPRSPTVWDGRYEVQAKTAGLTIDALQGHASRLPKAQRSMLARLPAAVRPGLPAILGLDAPMCPTLAPLNGRVSLTDLTPARFLAACGAIAQESELAQGAHGATREGVLCSSPVMK